MKYKGIRRLFRWIVFVIYLALLFYVLFFSEVFDRDMISTQYRYNLVPFKEIKRFITHYRYLGISAVMTNIAGNVLAFIPFGFYLPLVTNHKTRFLLCLFLTVMFSTSIELLQLITKVGCCDVDDVILNTLGGILGFAIYYVTRKIVNNYRDRSVEEK